MTELPPLPLLPGHSLGEEAESCCDRTANGEDTSVLLPQDCALDAGPRSSMWPLESVPAARVSSPGPCRACLRPRCLSQAASFPLPLRRRLLLGDEDLPSIIHQGFILHCENCSRKLLLFAGWSRQISLHSRSHKPLIIKPLDVNARLDNQTDPPTAGYQPRDRSNHTVVRDAPIRPLPLPLGTSLTQSCPWRGAYRSNCSNLRLSRQDLIKPRNGRSCAVDQIRT